jgi:serine kinase of HPr protein (carbohydrate metabolism regulator)
LKKGNVGIVKINNTPTNVYVNGQELHTTLSKYMQMSKISIGYPFGINTKDIKFEAELIDICTEIFAIKLIKEQDKNQELAARLANYLFEGFASFWLGY